ncbi:hypothetical protein [Hymenobacter elongatus]|uniref:Uncharacterized protein n=1 Tax=Hymenobacter elongatus TaxID=877208 RepID=A0A4Z0PHH4_9BACT|nr:hypothetical protein [Hymenobacter elongatus]TGE14459.1 hypothetical protein E5J99_15985 [Hymenobacter elongatus]
MTWAFRKKETALETYYNRTVKSEYGRQTAAELAFWPGSLLLSGHRLYAVSAQSPEVYVYSLSLQPVGKLRFPASLRMVLNFSVQGDTAYATDGTQMMVALNMRT